MSDPLDDINATLAKDGIYVHPSMQPLFTPAQLTAIKEDLAAAKQPVFLVVYPLEYGDEYGGRSDELLAQLHDRSGTPGLYFSAERPFDDGQYYLDDSEWDVPQSYGDGRPYEATSVAEAAHPKDLAAGMVELADLYGQGTVSERYRELQAEETSSDPGSDRGDGSAGDDGGVSGGAVGSIVLAVAALGIGLAIWRSRQVKRRQQSFTLPRSATDRIREAHDDRLEARARAEVLALGEAIDAAEITRTGNADSWQAALDHYDGAGRVLRGTDPDVLDVVGAIVLAERGQAALRAARAGRAWQPRKPCFLNPLHGPGMGDRTVQSAAGPVKVPLCRACSTDLQKGRRPDILDVLRKGEPVHYFDAGVRPWSSSGYGALEPDLVRALHQRR